MKVYRQSFWKADTTRSRIFPLIFVSLLCLPILLSRTYDWTGMTTFVWIWLGIIAFLLFILVFAAIPSQYFYVIIDEKKLIIKNAIYPFLKGEYSFTDIKHIEIGNKGGLSNDYIQVVNQKNKRSWRYVFDLVSRKEYNNLIRGLKEKGLEVRTKSIDNILKEYP